MPTRHSGGDGARARGTAGPASRPRAAPGRRGEPGPQPPAPGESPPPPWRRCRPRRRATGRHQQALGRRRAARSAGSAPTRRAAARLRRPGRPARTRSLQAASGPSVMSASGAPRGTAPPLRGDLGQPCPQAGTPLALGKQAGHGRGRGGGGGHHPKRAPGRVSTAPEAGFKPPHPTGSRRSPSQTLTD